MKVLEVGHMYQPAIRNVDGKEMGGEVAAQKIIFINKQPGQEHAGTTTQEVLRVLLDRTRHCANCMPHRNNEQIVYHLRMALALHEARALERKVEKGLEIEYQETDEDGHLLLKEGEVPMGATEELVPYRHDWDRPCNHPVEQPSIAINNNPART